MVCTQAATARTDNGPSPWEARGSRLRLAGPAPESPAGLLTDSPPGYSIYRAVSRDDLMAAYSFLCRSRERLGYPRPTRTSGWAGAAGGKREVATFLAKSWPDVVGTATLVVDSWGRAIPADRAFPEIGSLREQGRFLCEATHRAMVPAYYRTPAPHDLLRCCVAHGLFVGCTDLVVAARPWETERFAALGFDRVSPIRCSGGAVPEPRVLVRLDLTALHQEGLAPGLPADTEGTFLRRHYVRGNPFRQYVQRWASLAEQGLRKAG